MTRPAARRRRSVVDWGIRLTLAAILSWAGIEAVRYSLATALPKAQLENAYALAPHNAQIAAALSEQLTSSPNVTAADRSRADQLARTAILRDPTAVQAAATLGTDTLVRGDLALGSRFFTYSAFVSRRDLRTQLWLIEDSVGRGDVPGALKHYDIALRTKPYAQDLLFPILGSAIENPAIRAELVRTLAQKPLWGDDFIEYVAGRGPVPLATASLLNDVQRAGRPMPVTAIASIVSALINHGNPDAAWAFYAARHRGADRRLSRDPTFVGETDNPSAFDWSTNNADGVTAAIQRDEKGGLVDFSAPSGIGGIALQQVQLLPAGDYVLVGHSVAIDQPAQSLPFWQLSCRAGRELGRTTVTNSAESGGNFMGRFTVPDGCPIQVLSLVIQPSDATTGVSGQVDRVQLRPTRDNG